MEVILWTLLGVFIGIVSGWVLCSVIVAGKISDLESEIADLRIQRQLLKEEIFRLSIPKAKPTPRKKRKHKTRKSK
jgi:hypothetical protein